MRPLFLGWLLLAGVFGAAAQPWDGASPADAEARARTEGKPLIVLWQAGAGAPAFTQGVDRLFTAWPEWTRQVLERAVLTRGRSWESPLPESFPPLADPKVSALVVWAPGSQAPAVWTEVPPVLELSRRLSEASGAPLADPYRVDVAEFAWEGGVLTRVGDGPLWSALGPGVVSDWVEEGPLGSVLVLRELKGGRRAAFPLEGDWSFLYSPGAQSWTPWNPVLVKRR